MDLYLRVEISARELQSKLLVGLLAASRGHSVLVAGDRPTLLRALMFRKRGRSGIVNTNSLTPGKSFLRFQQIFRMAGCEQTNLDEEGGFFWRDYLPFAKSRYGDLSLALASRVFCWGNHEYSVLRKTFPQHRDRFRLIGSPRVDLWSPRFSNLYQADLPGIQKPYVLVASSIHGPLDGLSLEDKVQTERINDLQGDGVNHFHRTLKGYVTSARLSLEYLRLLQVISSELPEVTIVIKPHPVESPAKWRELIGSLDRVVVVESQPASQLIRQSSAVITTGSTTGLEAAAAGVPLIEFQPKGLSKEGYTNLLSQLGTPAQEPGEVIRVLKRVLGNQQASRSSLAANQEVSDRIYVAENQLAAERMVAEWEALGRTESHDVRTDIGLTQRFTYWLYWIFFAFFQFSLPLFRPRLRFKKARRAEKHPPLHKESVASFVSQLSDLLELQDQVTLRFRGKRSLSLTPKG